MAPTPTSAAKTIINFDNESIKIELKENFSKELLVSTQSFGLRQDRLQFIIYHLCYFITI